MTERRNHGSITHSSCDVSALKTPSRTSDKQVIRESIGVSKAVIEMMERLKILERALTEIANNPNLTSEARMQIAASAIKK